MKVWIGLAAGTTTSIGEPASKATGRRSFAKLNGALANSVTLAACVSVMASNVLPSGGALATASAPICPPPPGLLSTTTLTFQRSANCWPTIRAITSVRSPGGNGTT